MLIPFIASSTFSTVTRFARPLCFPRAAPVPAGVMIVVMLEYILTILDLALIGSAIWSWLPGNVTGNSVLITGALVFKILVTVLCAEESYREAFVSGIVKCAYAVVERMRRFFCYLWRGAVKSIGAGRDFVVRSITALLYNDRGRMTRALDEGRAVESGMDEPPSDLPSASVSGPLLTTTASQDNLVTAARMAWAISSAYEHTHRGSASSVSRRTTRTSSSPPVASSMSDSRTGQEPAVLPSRRQLVDFLALTAILSQASRERANDTTIASVDTAPQPTSSSTPQPSYGTLQSSPSGTPQPPSQQDSLKTPIEDPIPISGHDDTGHRSSDEATTVAVPPRERRSTVIELHNSFAREDHQAFRQRAYTVAIQLDAAQAALHELQRERRELIVALASVAPAFRVPRKRTVKIEAVPPPAPPLVPAPFSLPPPLQHPSRSRRRRRPCYRPLTALVQILWKSLWLRWQLYLWFRATSFWCRHLPPILKRQLLHDPTAIWRRRLGSSRLSRWLRLYLLAFRSRVFPLYIIKTNAILPPDRSISRQRLGRLEKSPVKENEKANEDFRDQKRVSLPANFPVLKMTAVPTPAPASITKIANSEGPRAPVIPPVRSNTLPLLPATSMTPEESMAPRKTLLGKFVSKLTSKESGASTSVPPQPAPASASKRIRLRLLFKYIRASCLGPSLSLSLSLSLNLSPKSNYPHCRLSRHRSSLLWLELYQRKSLPLHLCQQAPWQLSPIEFAHKHRKTFLYSRTNSLEASHFPRSWSLQQTRRFQGLDSLVFQGTVAARPLRLRRLAQLLLSKTFTIAQIRSSPPPKRLRRLATKLYPNAPPTSHASIAAHTKATISESRVQLQTQGSSAPAPVAMATTAAPVPRPALPAPAKAVPQVVVTRIDGPGVPVQAEATLRMSQLAPNVSSVPVKTNTTIGDNASATSTTPGTQPAETTMSTGDTLRPAPAGAPNQASVPRPTDGARCSGSWRTSLTHVGPHAQGRRGAVEVPPGNGIYASIYAPPGARARRPTSMFEVERAPTSEAETSGDWRARQLTAHATERERRVSMPEQPVRDAAAAAAADMKVWAAMPRKTSGRAHFGPGSAEGGRQNSPYFQVGNERERERTRTLSGQRSGGSSQQGHGGGHARTNTQTSAKSLGPATGSSGNWMSKLRRESGIFANGGWNMKAQARELQQKFKGDKQAVGEGSATGPGGQESGGGCAA
ncbi:uncharacterized protein BXZ73DRAFT_98627 [Epithele typhae]|uniref:uncharacterized protein n=1 Tax=Epithele typhae TaxID=378194 RepID=UPI0020084EB7|nr:uncharacterized protein BXZ73DRAFT_98627 [Epithele typhae]KAH9940800.1 hypothetical protein BXZ73DRAFT_98627 [Epithele typhae]